MLRSLLIATLLATLPTACTASPAEIRTRDAAMLAKALADADSFQFYFISRTEEYSLTNAQLKAQSSVRIFRRCGANCARTLDLVVQHLNQAEPVACIAGPGMQNVLLELSSGRQVVYSHAGLQVSVNGHCYLSETSINTILDRTDYIFK